MDRSAPPQRPVHWVPNVHEEARQLTPGSFDDSAGLNETDDYLFDVCSPTRVDRFFQEAGFRVALRHGQRPSILAGKLVGRADQSSILAEG